MTSWTVRSHSQTVAAATVIACGLTTAALLYKPFRSADFYPLYYGAAQLVQGQSPYAPAAEEHLLAAWRPARDGWAVPVVAYPAPALLVFAPLTVLPDWLAGAVWMFAAIVGLCIALGRIHPALVWLPLCYLPFLQSVWVQNISLLWCALAVLVLTRTVGRIPTGLALAILPLKPQEGLIVAAYGLWQHRHDRRIVGTALATLAGLCLLATILSPSWPSAWLTAVQTYAAATPMQPLWPLALVFLLPGLPATVRVVGIQVVAFPLNDLYRAGLLIYLWSLTPWPWRALAAVSLLGLYWFPRHNAYSVLYVLVLLPALAMTVRAAVRERAAQVTA